MRSAQRAGFTLDQARELLTLDASNDRDRARILAETRLQALERKIAELTTARGALERLAAACAKGTGTDCPILQAFDAG